MKNYKEIDIDSGKGDMPLINIDLNMVKKQVKIEVEGITIYFPYQPYECQINYMSCVIRSIKTGNFSALESPTGTGKTLSLLCASLAWLSHDRKQKSLMGKNEGGATPCHTIFYSSRTHSQLSNVMKELKKTVYRPRTCILGSRKTYCVNDLIKQKPGGIDQNCKIAVKAKACKFHQFSAPESGNMLDIEDLKNLGFTKKSCPFYSQRKKVTQADIILLPYNYLVDQKIKEALSLNLKNNIIIFDEAHNLDKVLEDAKSLEITIDQLSAWNYDLRNFSKACESIDTMLDQESEKYQDQISTLNSIDLKKVGNVIRSIDNLGLYLMKLDIKTEKRLSVKEFFNVIFDGSLSRNKKIEYESLDSFTNRGKNDDIVENETMNQNPKVDEKQGNRTKVIGNIGEGFRPGEIKNVRDLVGLCDLSITDYLKSSSCLSSLKDFMDLLNELYENYQQYQERKIKEIDYVENSFKFIMLETEILGVMNKFGKQMKNKVKKLCIFCLNPGFGFKNFNAVGPKTVILTSGTLSPIQGLESELKCPFQIRLENTHVIDPRQVKLCLLGRNPKEDDPERGRLIFDYTNKTNQSMMEGVGETIKSLCVITKGGILVFFTSFAYLDDCTKLWKLNKTWDIIESKRRIFRDSKDQFFNHQNQNEDDDKSNVVTRYKDHVSKGNNGILFTVCRGSSSEGIDFADNLSRLVIVVGIPFPSMGDMKVKLKREYLKQIYSNAAMKIAGVDKLTDSEWYIQTALRAVNQSIGRSIRHIKDYGCVILLDERYSFMPPNNFSSWTRKSIMKYNNKTIFKDIIEFYKGVESVINSRPDHIYKPQTRITKQESSSDSDDQTAVTLVSKKLDSRKEEKPKIKAFENRAELANFIESEPSKRELKSVNLTPAAEIGRAKIEYLKEYYLRKSLMKSSPVQTDDIGLADNQKIDINALRGIVDKFDDNNLSLFDVSASSTPNNKKVNKIMFESPDGSNNFINISPNSESYCAKCQKAQSMKTSSSFCENCYVPNEI